MKIKCGNPIQKISLKQGMVPIFWKYFYILLEAMFLGWMFAVCCAGAFDAKSYFWQKE